MAIIKCPAWLSFIWFGMTAGISFLAAPLVVSAARPAALDAGRIVLEALNKAEFVALIVLLILIRMSNKAREFLLPVAGLALILISQSVWLLPELATGAVAGVADVDSGQSMAHSVYLVLEITKLMVLIYLGFKSLQILTLDQQFRE